MTTEQQLEIMEEMKASYNFMYTMHNSSFSALMRDIFDKIEQLEKQAAIDALAKAERMNKISDELNLPHNDIRRILDVQRYEAILRRLGAMETFLTVLIDDMTADDRELIAQQFDTHIFESDEAMAKRFRDANNKGHENN